MKSSNADFFTTIVNEINNERPVILSMPNHMTVADGYASDGTGKKIHINLGWGGSHDDFYYLDQTNTIGNLTFTPNHTIYYNIKPCQGGECSPYPPESTTNPPIIASDLNDMVIEEDHTLRIDTYDPNGDSVTLSATSSCNSLQSSVNTNLLTLTPGTPNTLCKVTYPSTADRFTDPIKKNAPPGTTGGFEPYRQPDPYPETERSAFFRFCGQYGPGG
jgi:Peptidase C10 family